MSSKKKKKGSGGAGVVEPGCATSTAALWRATGAHVARMMAVGVGARELRGHLTASELQNNLLEQAVCALGHAFSPCKVKFNPAWRTSST